MNKVVLMGRLTRDPEVRYIAGENPLAIARYTLAIDRRIKKEGENSADFIPCVVFGKSAEFVEKYFRQGMRVTISGRIQTGSYTNNEGKKVFTTEVVVEEQEFAENKNAPAARTEETQRPENHPPTQAGAAYAPPQPYADGFMNIPEGLEEELPFN